jgi:hypothetical protein
VLSRVSLRRPTVALVAAPALVALVLGIDAWSTMEAREQTREATEVERVLDTNCTELRQRYEAKTAMIDDLIAGRTTLAEVTAQFMLMNRDRPACMAVIRSTWPGATDEEMMARNVIGFVDTSLQGDTETDRAEVRSRLDAQLTAMFAPHSDPAVE